MHLLFDMKLFDINMKCLVEKFKCMSTFEFKSFYENDYTLHFLFAIIAKNV